MQRKYDSHDLQHLRNIGVYARQIEAIYQSAEREAAAVGASVHNFNPDRPFSFADYPQTRARIDALLNKLQGNVQTVILNGVDAEWTLSNNKNNELSRRVFGNNIGRLSAELERRYFTSNEPAREAFKARKTAGLNLSDRIWKYTDQFKEEIEMGLDLGLRDGRSAAEMARDLRQYLQEPDRLFRRVRDEHGQLHLSRQAAAYNPGAGVYRSSRKNALRLARTEVNIAYRTADHDRWQGLDFVVGVEVMLSNNHPIIDICDELAGKYPKTFKFTGWHPACRCFAVPILKTEEELAADTERILNGEATNTASVNRVAAVPDKFEAWVRENEARIAVANSNGTLPYFLKDNRRLWRDFTSIEVINRQVIAQTTRLREVFGAKSERLAERVGAAVTPVNVKSEARILEKATNSYDGDVARVGDIIRNTFIVGEERVQATLKAIEQTFNVERVKQHSTPMGYTGHLLNVWVRDGVRAEIQINTPQMIYAKEVQARSILGTETYKAIRSATGLPPGMGHKYYEQWRVMSSSEQASKKGRDLMNKSRRYYDKIRDVKLPL
jgi:hypothetical protein